MVQNDLQKYEVRIKSLQAHSEQQSKVLKRKTEEVNFILHVYIYIYIYIYTLYMHMHADIIDLHVGGHTACSA